MGITPLNLELYGGIYTIKIKKGGYEEYTKTICVDADKTETIKLTLKEMEVPKNQSEQKSGKKEKMGKKDMVVVPEQNLESQQGKITIKSIPSNAKIYIDGFYMGESPTVITLNEGIYNLKVIKEGYEEYTKTVKITPGQSKLLNIKFDKTGILIITSEPANAEVYTNGDFKGKTPLKLEIKEDVYVIRISKDGYNDYTETMKLDAGKTVEVNGKLEKIKSEDSLSDIIVSILKALGLYQYD